MLTRYARCAPPGLLMTLCLIWAMQALIGTSTGAAAAATPRLPVYLVQRTLPPPTPVTEHNPPDRIDPPRPLPDHRPPIPVQQGDPTTYTVPTRPEIPGTPVIDLTGEPRTDGPLISLVNVQPQYPPALAARGIEGHVTVRFDVTTAGTVDNVVVVEASDSAFHRSALQAAARFRFKARIVDGEPVPTYGVLNRFIYRMEEH